MDEVNHLWKLIHTNEFKEYNKERLYSYLKEVLNNYITSDIRKSDIIAISICNFFYKVYNFDENLKIVYNTKLYDKFLSSSLAKLKKQGGKVEKYFFQYIENIMLLHSLTSSADNNFEIRVLLFNISTFMKENDLEIEDIFCKHVRLYFKIFGINIYFLIWYNGDGFTILDVFVYKTRKYMTRNRKILCMIIDRYDDSEWFCKDHSQVIKKIISLKKDILKSVYISKHAFKACQRTRKNLAGLPK